MNFWKREPREEIVSEMPTGFFKLRFGGSHAPDCIAYQHPVFGLMFPVLNSFTCGGITFTRPRDKHGEFLPLQVWIKTLPTGACGVYTRTDASFADTTRLEDFDGEFIYEPTL
jgi:hypothetical protein